MRPRARLALFATIGLGAITLAPVARSEPRRRAVSLIKMPYRGERNLADLSDSPDYLEKGGLPKLLEQKGWRLRSTSTVALPPEEQKAYGEWNRLGLANGHLARMVAAEIREGGFPVGLLANCSALMGMLTVPGGPTSSELAAALTEIFRHEKAATFGVASTPSGDKDPSGRSRQAAYNLILGALDGVRHLGSVRPRYPRPRDRAAPGYLREDLVHK